MKLYVHSVSPDGKRIRLNELLRWSLKISDFLRKPSKVYTSIRSTLLTLNIYLYHTLYSLLIKPHVAGESLINFDLNKRDLWSCEKPGIFYFFVQIAFNARLFIIVWHNIDKNDWFEYYLVHVRYCVRWFGWIH